MADVDDPSANPVNEPLDLVRLSLNETVFVKLRGDQRDAVCERYVHAEIVEDQARGQRLAEIGCEVDKAGRAIEQEGGAITSLREMLGDISPRN
nr:putative u6 snrna-associated sm-like protein lsm3 [Quercus suber]